VVRFVALAVLAVLVYVLLRAMVAAFAAGFRGGGRRGSPRALRDELVKDPVCETYVPRRAAVTRTTGGVTRHFCSAACAEKFEASSGRV
jgi:YHS domain-containing protein